MLTWSTRDGKYDPSASALSNAVSSRDLLREGFVEMGVIESTGVQVVEWLVQEAGASTSSPFRKGAPPGVRRPLLEFLDDMVEAMIAVGVGVAAEMD